MEFESWHYWFIGGFVFLVIEIFVPGFIMGSIGLGCLLASLGALLGLPLWMNIIFVIIGFFIGISLLKPVLKHLEKPTHVKTNSDGLIGRTGIVTEKIDPSTGSGRIRIDGDDWKAVEKNGEIIEKGTFVEVVSLESIVISVKKLENQLTGEANGQIKIPTSIHEGKGMVLSIGNKKELIHHNDISGFYSNQKISYLINGTGKQYAIDESLEKLEEIIDQNVFFRANRQFILSLKLIKEYRSDPGGGLLVYLVPQQNLPEFISVSRLKAHAFRKWVEKQVGSPR